MLVDIIVRIEYRICLFERNQYVGILRHQSFCILYETENLYDVVMQLILLDEKIHIFLYSLQCINLL
jgi:hypothetical protein